MNKRILLSVLAILGIAAMANAKIICHFPFDGDLNDASLNGYPAGDGTLYGETHYVKGKYGQALEFDGDEDFVQIMVAPGPGGWTPVLVEQQPQITIAMWVRMTEYPTEDTDIIATRAWYYGDHSIEFHTSVFGYETPFFIVSQGDWLTEYPHQDMTTDLLADPNEVADPNSEEGWFHLAVTYDTVAEQAYMYFNGIPGAVAPITSGSLVNIGNYTLGGKAAENHRYFKGQIDDLYIYNQVLSPAEIIGLMDGIEPVEQFECGDSGYFAMDINKDCYVNILDFALMSNEWLKCTDMNDPSCETIPWTP